MNILLVTTSYPLNPESSSGIFVKRLKKSLDKLCNVEVVCPDDSDTLKREPGVHCSRYSLKKWQILAHQPGGIPAAVRRDPRFFLFVPFLLISMMISISRRLRATDLIFANWAINAVIAWLPSIMFRKPVITTFRGEDVRNLDKGVQTFIVWMALRVSDAVVLVSKDMKAQLEQRFPRFKRKLFVIPNGVEDLLLDSDIAARAPANSVINILSVASLIPRKDIATLLKAVACINNTAETKSDIKLDIVGDGELRASLEALSYSEGIDGIVKFHGMLSPDKVGASYSESQIFVLPSLYEGRPNVVVEAMAAGCSVVVSDIDGCRELISNNKNGLLFTGGDYKKLAKSIERVISDPQLRVRLGQSARQYVVDNRLSWDGCAGGYFKLFGMLLKKRI
ncbi:glycosyltransferase family 4 protein [Alkalimarinus coralli]|uniref:glycosyltransferase family 4 protein n=1 Tax=Alkalimarinus coralli TaxID=2935863 RepID=UPI00202B94A5|nr:glycosyltransferase family 4 protein [Alkalimarinus coralli]